MKAIVRNGSHEDHSDSEEEMEVEVPSVQRCVLTPGHCVPLPGNTLIDYFSLFVDESTLQHIVVQIILNIKQCIQSHTLAPHSRIR